MRVFWGLSQRIGARVSAAAVAADSDPKILVARVSKSHSMLPYRDSRLIRIGLLAFFILVGVYAIFEGRALLRGPSIEVSPRVMEVTEPFITISGKALRIASLSLNGSPVPVTEDGVFEEGYVLSVGYNRITLTARDKYGKTAERVIEIVYTPKNGTGTTSSPDVTEGQ